MVWRLLYGFIFSISLVSLFGLWNSAGAESQSSHLVSIYDRGTTRLFVTNQPTIGAVLKAEHINLDPRDTVEPSVSEKLVASNYYVNIYRARPVLVVDGNVRIKTISSHQTADQIANDVGIPLYDGDTTTLTPITDFTSDGAGLQLAITRATPVTLELYGNQIQIRTQAKTVGDLLQEKNIVLGKNDHLSVAKTTPITQDLDISIWREGVQTLSVNESIPVIGKIVYDADQPLLYRAIQTPGIPGNQLVTYQVDIEAGVEVSRIQIASITTRNPTEQVTVIGLQNNGSGLTKAKGAQYYTDSNGVSHRETYYDLNMTTAMESCGQGGHYSVRPDGAKVDAQGYIIVAADYAIYPKCSIVETSLGLAKVYDTGGFVARYPDGFDIATDWTIADGI